VVTERRKEQQRDRTGTGETIDSGRGLSTDVSPAVSFDHLSSHSCLSTSPVSQPLLQNQKDNTDDHEWHVTFQPTKQPGKKVQSSLETVPEGDVPSYLWKQKTEEGLPEDPNEFLLNASRKGSKDDVELAIKKFGAEFNHKHETGITALLEACKNGHTDVAEFLIKSGADVNEKGTDDRTPLHEAAEAGDLQTVELLLKEKAETVERTRIDATPYDLAYKKGHSEVGSPFNLYCIPIMTVTIIIVSITSDIAACMYFSSYR